MEGHPVRLFTLRGKADLVGREQVRSFLAGSLIVLGYHDWVPERLPLDVRIRKKLDRPDWIGSWHPDRRVIELRASNTPEQMLTACVHEVIHATRRFPAHTLEKCTSTLTARLKPDVLHVADLLLVGCYKRAAFLAHTKLSYRTEAGDHYDDAQHDDAGVIPRYRSRKKPPEAGR
jgi:hypothetical protein